MESASIPKKRIAYIDIAKGIGILLVVLGHNDVALVSPFLHQVIYSFHMPLFFFLSGYFFKPNIPFVDLLGKRFNTLLKPYIFTLFLIYGTAVSFEKMSFETALRRIAKSAYASGYYLDWVQLWFIPHLFLLSLYAFAFYKIFSAEKNRWLRLPVLLGLQAFGVYIIATFWGFQFNAFGKSYELFGLPFSADLILVSGFFFVLGRETRALLVDDFFKKLWVLIVSGASLLALNYFFREFVDFNGRHYPNWGISTLKAILGIVFVLSISMQIGLRMKRTSSVLQYFGNASLFILIFHVPIQAFWGEKIRAVGGSVEFSIGAAFIVGVLGPLLIYELFIRRNPTALWWFGRSSEKPSARQQDK